MKPILRPDAEGVSPVVAEILLVAIAVVLAAVLYIMASSLLSTGTSVPPVVAFSAVHPFSTGSYNATFSVADASRTIRLPNYHFVLKVGTTLGPRTDFAASTVAAMVTVNGTVYRVTWTDLDGGGALTRGDLITVSGNGASLPRATLFDFSLLWSDGSLLTDESWATP
jgi:flagellin-like protein